ncbi:MAG: NAD-dependent epimerase/dehydratase, partial [Bryobacterales bacterium]|nr:NAD-dependent epimerase/dehydratase [Bryobacterales bacterium]
LFEWIELWNTPNDLNEWDSRLDRDWRIFSEMVGGAAYWIHKRGKKTVMPGLWPTDLDWLTLMHERGVLAYIDAVGVQGYPATTEFEWRGWDAEIAAVRGRLNELHLKPEVWITQAGFSTWRGDERAQVRAFIEAADADADRMYWYSAHDESAPQFHSDSFHSDERDYHYGLKRADGAPKLLYDLLAHGGVAAVRESESARAKPRAGDRKKHVLITGGAGFIGTNLASRLLTAGHSIMVYDNLSRPGAERNLQWLQETYGKGVHFEQADVRDAQAVRRAVNGAEQVFHFAAQVAVTTSLEDPRHDFDVNVGGTLNVLEALRAMDNPPPLLFTSTNKVYGGLSDLALEANGKRYQPLDALLRTGVSESRRLDFHSPYGCSKGAADQYVLDYARTFNIPAIVFRMSCIYGLHQNGTEDQGWVAHFLIRALEGKPLTLYGDGMQVRDLLFAEDLVDAFLLAQGNAQSLSGQVFNIGGGLGNTISLLDLLDLIGSLGDRPPLRYQDWRPGDQRYYVSDIRKFKVATGWTPKVNVQQGLRRLHSWLSKTRGIPAPHSLPIYGALDAVFTH